MGKRVLIYGASGFVGGGLAALLADEGWHVTGVSRKGTGDVKGVSRWLRPDEVDLAGLDAVVNLAGEPIDQKWTKQKKRQFHASRVGLTESLVNNLEALPVDQRPGVLVNASAVGFYGAQGDTLLEDHAPQGRGYLADLCADWEEAAMRAESFGVRVVCIRIGIVLGSEGRAFQKLKTVFKMGLGGNLGDGRQWMPWIHVDDLRRIIAYCLTREDVRGAVNGTAPYPERNADFTQKMAKAMKRWVFLPVPGSILKMVLGEFAEALLVGQKAIPARLTKARFEFRYPRLENALKDLIP